MANSTRLRNAGFLLDLLPWLKQWHNEMDPEYGMGLERVLVPGDATIRTLHETVQVVMGWANCHLHQFIIHGKEYGVAYEGGISFADNPDKVRLSDFRFQPHEGFEYVYDLGDNWEHDIRVEKILAFDTARAYPVCIVGAQPCPPEDSGGAWCYMFSAAHEKTSQKASANAFTWQGQ